MKHIEKNRFTKKQKTALILAAILLALVAILIPIGIINGKYTGENKPISVPEILEGEARQNGLTLAYPVVNSQTQVQHIEVKNSTGKFGFSKLEGDDYLTMYYYDENDALKVYYPEICSKDPSFDYTDLYRIDTTDSFGVYSILDYLCLGFRMPYFNDRIILSEDSDKKARQLDEYGLSEQKASVVSFSYLDESGSIKTHIVKIGDKGVVGRGYYFMVDDRPYVYNSGNNYYDYAVDSISIFLKPLLVADGLEEDSGFGPFLTTGYYQWAGTKHDKPGETVAEDSRVVVFANVISTVLTSSKDSNGYENVGYSQIEIDLESVKGVSRYDRMIAAFKNKQNGTLDKELVFTLTSTTNALDFSSKDSLRYEYVITAIEAVLTDSGEISEVGTEVGNENNLVKVTYTSKREGIDTAPHTRHAVIDLADGGGIPVDARAKIRGAKIGGLPAGEQIAFSIDYTKENSISYNGKYIITEIISIYDQKGKKETTVKENSIVGYKYKVETNGEITEEKSFIIDLSKAAEETELKIKELVLGKKISKGLNLEFASSNVYCEYFMNFSTYKISRIDYFIESELRTAFRFQNSSVRDPYYGESLYENLMEDEHKLYGLNSNVCEFVVKILGGLSEDSSTATASGLVGTEVEAVGLSPSVMDKYGLYKHRIYFELPRGIYAYTPNEGATSDDLDDYGYYSTLGFNLYISDVDPKTNTRYVASDMYDIVTKISADDFEFLDYTFEGFWARRQLILLDIKNVKSLGVEFFMSDLKGNYTFDLIHQESSYQTPSGGLSGFDKITVKVTPEGDCTENELLKFIEKKNYSFVSLSEFYDSIHTDLLDEGHKDVYPDTYGTAYFKELIRMLYLTKYVDVLPESEREGFKKAENLIMRMTLEITSSSYEYVYEFYRGDDRRILVSIHKENERGEIVTTPVADFYISTLAMKKIANNVVGILNGELIDIEEGYSD